MLFQYRSRAVRFPIHTDHGANRRLSRCTSAPLSRTPWSELYCKRYLLGKNFFVQRAFVSLSAQGSTVATARDTRFSTWRLELSIREDCSGLFTTCPVENGAVYSNLCEWKEFPRVTCSGSRSAGRSAEIRRRGKTACRGGRDRWARNLGLITYRIFMNVTKV